jgi:hypothetical protein
MTRYRVWKGFALWLVPPFVVLLTPWKEYAAHASLAGFFIAWMWSQQPKQDGR